jgi:hypothetical protein
MGNKKTTLIIDDVSNIETHLKVVSNQLASGRVKIRKAKIKDALFLEAEYTRVIGDEERSVKEDSTAPIHDDLKQAFSRLDEHLSNLCDQADECICKGFSIGGSGDHEGVTLIGSREIEYGILNLVSPFVKWDSSYASIIELSEAIEACKHEVKQYLFEGKHKPEAQQELPFGDDTDTITEEDL